MYHPRHSAPWVGAKPALSPICQEGWCSLDLPAWKQEAASLLFSLSVEGHIGHAGCGEVRGVPEVGSGREAAAAPIMCLGRQRVTLRTGPTSDLWFCATQTNRS